MAMVKPGVKPSELSSSTGYGRWLEVVIMVVVSRTVPRKRATTLGIAAVLVPQLTDFLRHYFAT